LLTTLFARGNVMAAWSVLTCLRLIYLCIFWSTQDDYYCDDEELLAAIQPIIGEFRDQLENLWSIGKKIYYFSTTHAFCIYDVL
jgi:hypothetical protein